MEVREKEGGSADKHQAKDDETYNSLERKQSRAAAAAGSHIVPGGVRTLKKYCDRKSEKGESTCDERDRESAHLFF